VDNPEEFRKEKVVKWNARVFAQMTLDFEIEAQNEKEVEAKINMYLPYIEYGKLEKQPLTVKVGNGDKLTNVFIMEKEIEDVYELDEL
jgi:hypothetical protein